MFVRLGEDRGDPFPAIGADVDEWDRRRRLDDIIDGIVPSPTGLGALCD